MGAGKAILSLGLMAWILLAAEPEAKKIAGNLPIIEILAFISIIAGFVHQNMMARRQHQWAMEEAAENRRIAAETQQMVGKVEKQTNGMHSALMASASKEGFRQGLAVGEAEAAIVVKEAEKLGNGHGRDPKDKSSTRSHH